MLKVISPLRYPEHLFDEKIKTVKLKQKNELSQKDVTLTTWLFCNMKGSVHISYSVQNACS